MRLSILFALLFQAITLLGQAPGNASPLSIESIMQGERFVGFLPENPFWSEDGKYVYFSWNPGMDTLRSLYKASVQGGEPLPVSPEEQILLPVAGYYSEDRSMKIYEKFGDLFLLDLKKNETRRLTQTQEDERRPQFGGEDRFVVFQRGINLFSWEIGSGALVQLTTFQAGSPPSSAKKTDPDLWIESDQLALFEVLNKRKSEEEARKYRRELREPKSPKAIYLENRNMNSWQTSPDMRFVVYRLLTSANANPTKVPHFVTESGYVEFPNARAKVGNAQDRFQTFVYDRLRDTSFALQIEGLPGIFDKPAFLAEYHSDTIPFETLFGNPRATIVHGPYFSEDGKALAEVKSMDGKDRWIVLIDLENGALRALDRQHDDAWIGGPGISGWKTSAGTLGWVDDQTPFFQSEESGFSHLYSIDLQSGLKTALTSGNFEILELKLSLDKKWFYLGSNKESPHERHFYRMSVRGGKMERLTRDAGSHQVTLSPDEKNAAILYSFSNKPWELFIKTGLDLNSPLRQVTNSTTPDFRKYAWRVPEIVHFTARDGAKVPARLYRPPGAALGGPAVIFVHGAWYLQNVHQWWSTYYREYMFHNLLVDNGYTVLDIDYRASEGYGRDWRTAIYRHMGGKDLDDHVDGAAYLVKELGVDPARIGIYGGSYGGFITLMALFNSPGTFKCGAALRSVTDWAHYNHAYTANILNTPLEDSIAYRKSSPIYFAEGLQDRLLILHGMVDDNVQFQDVVRLSQRLIELGKENWEFAVFPVESHGFVEPSSWTDEYKRVFKLFQEELGGK
ncbi:MAG: prolyl oligopeptidase family serine peptidase [Saprospirales bacterium]|nr:prolyl oligopeptidase family serine peptidase [Saprospirales bacterium]